MSKKELNDLNVQLEDIRRQNIALRSSNNWNKIKHRTNQMLLQLQNDKMLSQLRTLQVCFNNSHTLLFLCVFFFFLNYINIVIAIVLTIFFFLKKKKKKGKRENTTRCRNTNKKSIDITSLCAFFRCLFLSFVVLCFFSFSQTRS
ncbi:hypothetical protein RFI_12402 [Reticulomyxa filosa]|uniref:Uncharacterized protein n=1 Tax=Reticulomyxa filosa TaxID=46433 RepID=X6NFT0_RETFI|nr:hypothetical protein RFI_12402 [Reticulomyxa filosa]|eukprot:ETO24753.1 hypothetical protein RFI_12402 [Reticulomyxa filosa]